MSLAVELVVPGINQSALAVEGDFFWEPREERPVANMLPPPYLNQIELSLQHFIDH